MTPLGGARLGRSVRGAHPPPGMAVSGMAALELKTVESCHSLHIVPADLFRHLRRVELSRPVP